MLTMMYIGYYANKRAHAHDFVVSAHSGVFIYPHPPIVRKNVQTSLHKRECFVSHHRSDTDNICRIKYDINSEFFAVLAL